MSRLGASLLFCSPKQRFGYMSLTLSPNFVILVDYTWNDACVSPSITRNVRGKVSSFFSPALQPAEKCPHQRREWAQPCHPCRPSPSSTLHIPALQQNVLCGAALATFLSVGTKLLQSKWLAFFSFLRCHILHYCFSFQGEGKLCNPVSIFILWPHQPKYETVKFSFLNSWLQRKVWLPLPQIDVPFLLKLTVRMFSDLAPGADRIGQFGVSEFWIQEFALVG